MAHIQPKLEIVINPANPVQEVCEVIAAVTQFHPGNEIKMLTGIQSAIAKRIEELKGAEASG